MSGTKDIYRSPSGRDAISSWCRTQLEQWAIPHETSVIDTSLGPTFALHAGTGPAVILVAGTNFSTGAPG